MNHAGEAPGLEILLGDVSVGVLRSPPDERSEFAFAEAYLERADRPVLGQEFEDDLHRRLASRMRLPPFFSNLLPEGVLRELLAGRAGVHPEREYYLLQQLGDDLPGAIRARPLGSPSAPAMLESGSAPLPGDSLLKFSLAGVQLKFSVTRSKNKFTLPVRGVDGDWIVKLPDQHYARVPENEHAVMDWARAAGIEVPETLLVPVAQIDGLPESISKAGFAFAVRRFNRPAPGKRIHIEDFAQVTGQYAHDKYKGASYENLGALLLREDGQRSLDEFVRRLVFMALTRNADAHLKNWSLLYETAQHPRLSPAYDLVATEEFLPHGELALSLAGSKRFEDISLASFRAFARRLKTDEAHVEGLVRESVERMMQGFTALRNSEAQQRLAPILLERARHLPLVGEGARR